MFYAPHIVGLSSVVGARLEPLRYTLEGGTLTSNVYYDSPIFGRGWLNASGALPAAAKSPEGLWLNPESPTV